MAIDVSVIIPAYNRADLIGYTLDSILGQSHAPAEVIVVDDGSKDHTEAVVRGYAPRVQYLKIQNSGESRARNVGVAASSSKWIAFCDSDDLWHKDKLSKQVQLFERAPEVQYAFTNFRIVTDDVWSDATKFDSSPRGYWDLPKRQLADDLFVVDVPMYKSLLVHQPIFPSTVMMSRAYFEEAGRCNEPMGLLQSPDWDFALRCVSRPNIGVVSAPMVGIRKHATNFSRDPFLVTMGEVSVLRYILERHPMAKEHEALIREQIVIRSASAAEGAFAKGDFKTMRELLMAVPGKQRSWKLRLKSLIGCCPEEVSKLLRRSAIAARGDAAVRSHR